MKPVLSGINLVMAICVTTAFADQFTWEGSVDRCWGNPASWSGGDGTYPDGGNDSIAFNNDFIDSTKRSPLLLADAATNDMSVTLSGVSVSIPTPGNRSYAINNVSGGTGVLYFEDPSDTIVSVGGWIAGSNRITFNVNVVLKSALIINADGPSSGNTFFFSAPVSESGGSFSLAKSGPFGATLTAVNGSSGGKLIQSGTLVVSGSGTLGSGDVTVQAGSVLDLQTSGTINDTATLSLGEAAGTYGVVSLAAGVEEAVGVLMLNGVKAQGMLYGSSAANAVNSSVIVDDNHFSGAGWIVLPAPKATVIVIK